MGPTIVALLMLAPLVGCSAATGTGPPAPGPERQPTADEEPAPSGATEVPLEADAVLSRVDSLLESGAGLRAARLADSAYFRWGRGEGPRPTALRALEVEARALESTGRLVTAGERLEELLRAEPPPSEGLRRVAVRRLADIRFRLGLDPLVVELVARRSAAWSRENRLELLARTGARLSTSELTEAVAAFPPASPEAAVLRVQLARALALTGRADSAGRVAERALRGELPSEQRDLAEEVRAGLLGPADRGRLKVGVILPLSGSLESVGQLLEDGVRVALDELAASADSALVQVEIRDDSSDVRRAVRLVDRLESEGAVAVMGPVRSEAFAETVQSRDERRLLLVSPTATVVPGESWNAYSLWERDERRRAAARAVSGWLTGEAKFVRLGVLRTRDEAGVEAELDFRAGARRGGGYVSAATAYSPDSTTFESAVRPLAAGELQAAYLTAPDVRTALQLAPQLSYYGLRTTLVAGDLTWSEPAVVRRLQGGFPSHWISAVLVDRGEGTPWDAFRQQYEMKYDKPLLNNMLAPLAYDAMKLLLRASGRVALPRRGAVARAAVGGIGPRAAALVPSDLPTRESVTGSFTLVRGRTGVRRKAEVRVAGPRGLVAADVRAVRRWRDEAANLQQARQRRRREQAARRVDRWVEQQEENGS